MYLHEELETLTRTEIEALQFERLLRTVRRCMKSSFIRNGLPRLICLLKTYVRWTTCVRFLYYETDLRDNYPFGLRRGADERSGAPAFLQWHDGHPFTVILHTQKRFGRGANAVARCLYMVGLRRGDVFSELVGGTACLRADWASNTEPNVSAC